MPHQSNHCSTQGDPVIDIRTALAMRSRNSNAHTCLPRPGRGTAADARARARPRVALRASRQELDAATREQYFSLIARRASGVPTQYLTGHQEFWGLDFEVTPDVLIPRPETEHVIEVALERLGVRRRTADRARAATLQFASRTWVPAPAASPSRSRMNCPARASSPRTFPPLLSKSRAATPRGHESYPRVEFIECICSA